WRLYVFADASHPAETSSGKASALSDWAHWMHTDASSPVRRFTRAGEDEDALFDVKVIYQQRHDQFDVTDAPRAFLPV
ncbi:hypothetical protein ACWKSR_13185, partial [Campylobacter fetus subsp. venerealis]